jgi:predicted amidophosphoribosyltransferase
MRKLNLERGVEFMSVKPPKNRLRLDWYRFEKEETGDWVLKLPLYYADLFQLKESNVMQKSNTGWQDSNTGEIRYASFAGLTAAEVKQIEQFIEDYGRLVIIGLNKNLEGHFTDELDSCMALDYNLKSLNPLTRTGIGELVYQVKYLEVGDDRRDSIVRILSNCLSRAINRMPVKKSENPKCLSYIPPKPSKAYDLPQELAKSVADQLRNRRFFEKENCLIHSVLREDKQDLKDVKIERKLEIWQKIFSAGKIELSGSVRDCCVYVIDDLYQSGITMWSYAKYLKSQGAASVLGLVCEKSFRDTHN